MKLLIINGPNLGNIGRREPEIYGHEDFESYLESLKKELSEHEIHYFQSHHEGEIVEKLHSAEEENYDGIILNAGAYSHSSYAIRDAVAAISLPVVMVHISNVYARENFRHENVIAANCKGVVTGFGLRSYELAVMSFSAR
ncbi:MAG: type II 3-dehydroquinate dehydratase [Bacteroidales bacterium]|nr:type II 3-dehydroquinate dehydratase [Bacteroidales bacterium]